MPLAPWPRRSTPTPRSPLERPAESFWRPSSSPTTRASRWVPVSHVWSSDRKTSRKVPGPSSRSAHPDGPAA